MKKHVLLLASFFLSFILSAQDYTQLYMVGPATPAGWNNGSAVPMTLVDGSDAVFTWTGQMGTGQFKFLNAKGSWSNSFTAAATDANLVLGQSFDLLFNDGGDRKFVVATAGLYTVTVDMKKMTMLVSEATITFPSTWWIVGTAIPNGKAPVQADPSGAKAAFRYIGELIAGGSFKLISTETVSAVTTYLVPTTENTEILGETNCKLVSSATAAGWSVASTGTTYKIKFDGVANTVKTENSPWSELYMVGGATAADWTPANAIPFVVDPENPYQFTFDGELKIGTANDPSKFKILGQNTDWNPKSLHPYVFDEPIIGSTKLMVNGFDNKWIISSEQQGRYIVTVDLLYETIAAEYKGPVTSMQSNMSDASISVVSKKGSVEVVSTENIQLAVLTDLSGRRLEEVANGTNVTLGHQQPAGFYLLRLTLTSGEYVQKVLIN